MSTIFQVKKKKDDLVCWVEYGQDHLMKEDRPEDCIHSPGNDEGLRRKQ